MFSPSVFKEEMEAMRDECYKLVTQAHFICALGSSRIWFPPKGISTDQTSEPRTETETHGKPLCCERGAKGVEREVPPCRRQSVVEPSSSCWKEFDFPNLGDGPPWAVHKLAAYHVIIELIVLYFSFLELINSNQEKGLSLKNSSQIFIVIWGFPGGTSGKEPTCQCRRHKRCGFDPWVGKIS